MAWTAPLTAGASSRLTAAQFNTHIRDNLLLTEAGLAPEAEVDTDGFGTFYFVATGTDAIAARRTNSVSVRNSTSSTTTSTSYTNLSKSFGPSVTVTTGTQALVWITCQIGNSTGDALSAASFAVSGATTVAADDDWAIIAEGVDASEEQRFGVFRHITGLTAGTNTFTMKYRCATGTGRFQKRHIVVMAL